MTTRYGTQPVLGVAAQKRLSVSELGRRSNVPIRLLHNAVMGQSIPHPEIVRRLVRTLGVRAEELFTDEVLSGEYRARRRWDPSAWDALPLEKKDGFTRRSDR
jgi:transcriptional regulator with XRE-family HTH domain